ncbi:hypothetical protein D3C78_1153400 [compost metagenome]
MASGHYIYGGGIGPYAFSYKDCGNNEPVYGYVYPFPCAVFLADYNALGICAY